MGVSEGRVSCHAAKVGREPWEVWLMGVGRRCGSCYDYVGCSLESRNFALVKNALLEGIQYSY